MPLFTGFHASQGGCLGFLGPSTAGLDPHVGFSHIFCHMLHRVFSLVEIRKDTFR